MEELKKEIEELKEQLKNTSSRTEKEELKKEINELREELAQWKEQKKEKEGDQEKIPPVPKPITNEELLEKNTQPPKPKKDWLKIILG